MGKSKHNKLDHHENSPEKNHQEKKIKDPLDELIEECSYPNVPAFQEPRKTEFIETHETDTSDLNCKIKELKEKIDLLNRELKQEKKEKYEERHRYALLYKEVEGLQKELTTLKELKITQNKKTLFQFNHRGEGKTGDLVQITHDDDEISSSRLDPDTELLWHRLGFKSENSWNTSSATDNVGNIYVIGKFKGSFSLGNYHLRNTKGVGIFLVKSTPNGECTWVWKIGNITGPDIDCADLYIRISNESIFIVGGFNGNLDLEDNIYDLGVSKSIDADDTVFLIRLSHEGLIKYVKTVKGVPNGHLDFDIDSLDNLYLTGTFNNNSTFGKHKVFSPECLFSMYLTKLNSSGEFEWVRCTMGTGQASGYSVGVTSKGDICVTGTYEGTVSFDDKNTIIGPARLMSLFLVKYTPHGNIIWINRSKFDPSWLSQLTPGSEGVNSMIGESLGIDSDENIYITGTVNGMVILDEQLIDISPQSIFITKFDKHGKLQWYRLVDFTAPIEKEHGIHLRIVVEDSGYFYLTGYFSYNITFDDLTLSCEDGVSRFLSEYSPEGKCLWGIFIRGLIENDDKSISTDHHGSIILVGGFKNLMEIGDYEIKGSHCLNSVFFKFGRKLPSMIGVICDRDHNTISVELGPLINSISNLEPGLDYYLTSRGTLTTDPVLNQYWGTALGTNLLYHKTHRLV